MVFFTILKNTLRNCEKSLENAIIYISSEYWFKNLPTNSTEINFDFGSNTELVTKPFKLIAEIIVRTKSAGTKNEEIAVLLKYLSNFWGTTDMTLSSGKLILC